MVIGVAHAEEIENRRCRSPSPCHGQEIVFCRHAEAEFQVQREHGFDVSRDMVLSAVRKPDKVERGHKGRNIAQINVSATHLIRLIYEEEQASMRVITFYPVHFSKAHKPVLLEILDASEFISAATKSTIRLKDGEALEVRV